MTSTEKRREKLLSRATACERQIAELEQGKGADINRFSDWFKRWCLGDIQVRSEEEIEAAAILATAAGVPREVFINMLDAGRYSKSQHEMVEQIKGIRDSFFRSLRELSKEAKDYRNKARALKSLVRYRYSV